MRYRDLSIRNKLFLPAALVIVSIVVFQALYLIPAPIQNRLLDHYVEHGAWPESETFQHWLDEDRHATNEMIQHEFDAAYERGP